MATSILGVCVGWGASDEAMALLTEVVRRAGQTYRQFKILSVYRQHKARIQEGFLALAACDRKEFLELLRDLRLNLRTRPEFRGLPTDQLHYDLGELDTQLRGVQSQPQGNAGGARGWIVELVTEHKRWLDQFRREAADMKWKMMQCQIDPGSSPECQRLIDRGILRPR